jgi:hypothetical protein
MGQQGPLGRTEEAQTTTGAVDWQWLGRRSIGPPYLHLRRHHGWQIELFFKELKSTLGFHRYRFRRFVKVENWVQSCLVTFAYLEWSRARQLARRDLAEEDQRWWRWQRSHGLSLAVVQQAEEHDLAQLSRWSATPTGRRKLRQALRQALPLEYRRTG